MASYIFNDDSDEDFGSRQFNIHNAAEAGDFEALQALINPSKDADEQPEVDGIAVVPTFPCFRKYELDVRDDDECTPLHLALLNGHLECVRILLEGGARVEVHCEGSLPLHIAASMAALPRLQEFGLLASQLLCEHGASVYSRDDSARTALHWATLSGAPALVNFLVTIGISERLTSTIAPPEPEPTPDSYQPPSSPPPVHADLLLLTDDRTNTAFHLAARYAQSSTLRVLLAAHTTSSESHAAATALRTDVNEQRVVMCLTEVVGSPFMVRNKAGHTALHMAALGGCKECCAMLRHADRAASEVLDKRGDTPLQVAIKRGNHGAALVLGENVEIPDNMQAASPLPATIITSPDCLNHHTCPFPIIRGSSDVPPENVHRLSVLVSPETGILRTNQFASATWTEDVDAAAMTDVLRVHEWKYIKRVQRGCEVLSSQLRPVSHLDSDTAISSGTFTASMKAAGAVCTAVDDVIEGRAKRAFCAVRPPGHHAGPTGFVKNDNEAHGSNGFCILNNVAIGAAYALSMYRHKGVNRVVLLDFDVHHGNGTEACVSNTAPSQAKFQYKTPYSEGSQTFEMWRPWYSEADKQNIMFASVQGYGHRSHNASSWVYPGSGATCDTWEPPTGIETAAGANDVAATVTSGADGADDIDADRMPMTDTHADNDEAHHTTTSSTRVDEDPLKEFVYKDGQMPRTDGPRIINVGVPGPGTRVSLWHRAWRDKILPAVVNFNPDLIIVSAGFDAHRKDEINFQYIGVREQDFEWLTDQIVQVANRCCQGRVVSVLEGGYRIQGAMVSAYSRSVAAHVSALHEPNAEIWSEDAAAAERQDERRRREVKAADRERKSLARASRLAAEAAALAVSDSLDVSGALFAHVTLPQAQAGGGESLDGSMLVSTAIPDEPCPMDAVTAALEGGSSASVEGRGGKRRRTVTVDYVKLNAEMDREQASKGS